VEGELSGKSQSEIGRAFAVESFAVSTDRQVVQAIQTVFTAFRT
jgi:hypothetical protein